MVDYLDIAPVARLVNKYDSEYHMIEKLGERFRSGEWTEEDFKDAYFWKNNGNYKQLKKYLDDVEGNRDEVQEAFDLAKNDEIKDAINILVDIPGLSLITATWFLMIINPQECPVMDSVMWEYLMGEKDYSTAKDYLDFKKEVLKEVENSDFEGEWALRDWDRKKYAEIQASS